MKPFKQALDELLAAYANADLDEIESALDDAHERVENTLINRLSQDSLPTAEEVKGILKP